MQSFGANNQIAASGYSYDTAGDLTADGVGNTYQYNADGMLTASSGAQYVYDALNQRVEKTVGSAATEYVYFQGRVLAELNPGSTPPWTDMIYAGGAMIGEVKGAQTETPVYRLLDHLGSLAMTTDNSGNATGANVFLPFGQLVSSTTNDAFQFTGLEQDTENSSDHAWFRNYSTEQDRWLRPDPYNGSYDLLNPQSFNRYSYVENNPLRFVDPTGLKLPVGGGQYCVTMPIDGDTISTTDNQGGDTTLSYTPSSTTMVCETFGGYGSFGGLSGLGGLGGVGGVSGSADAANNGPTWKQKNQNCLNTINNTPDGKFYNTFSYASSFIGPDAGSLTFAQEVSSEGAQRGTLGFFKAGAQNWAGTALGSGSGFVAGAWETVDGYALFPVAAAATVGQVIVHAGCAIGSLF